LREAEKAGKKEERYMELEEEYLRLMNPVRTANAFGVEEIIDPKDTRKVVCSWAEHVYDVLIRERLADRASGKISPTFA
jgi:acetyl-CoA carboxylase carboxyltransferase component